MLTKLSENFSNCQKTGVVLRKLFPIFAQFVVAVTSPTNEKKSKIKIYSAKYSAQQVECRLTRGKKNAR